MKSSKKTQQATFSPKTLSVGNPKLCTREKNKGVATFFLEYYLGGTTEPVLDESGQQVYYTEGKMAGCPKFKSVKNRKKVAIPDLYIYARPDTQQKKLHNSTTKAEAEKIRVMAEEAFIAKGEIYGEIKEEDAQAHFNIMKFFKEYHRDYKKKDIRMVKYAIAEFTEYLLSKPKYKTFAKRLEIQDFKKEMVKGFADFLLERHRGEGANTIFARFKKMVKNAYENEYIDRNPCDGIVVRAKDDVIVKDILTKEEIAQLIATKVDRQSQDIRNAFLFCLFTGMRFCDVKDLKYSNADTTTRTLTFEQSKTKGHSSASKVTLKLNDIHLELIGDGEKDELIFKLPSHTMCLKSLRHWVKAAGIDKHITWHCARHSYGTMLITEGVNTRVAASMMGHSSMEYIMRYTRHIDTAKDEAMDKLTAGFSL